ncbi:MAG TPA: hemerythrin domain-containing protein [Terriglobales bacterium]|nr:hemerythrin domain-containing protein [Terriglobales bacterium]
MNTECTRRSLLQQSLTVGSTVLIAATVPDVLSAEPSANKEPEVTATEDLMREHGVIRRALLVYAECIPRLRQNAAGVDAAALHRTAQLFRTFGEDYHEKMLEEQHIFPTVRKMNGELAHYADILVAQHARGREITDYILSVTGGPKISANHAEPLARVFEGFVRMYENHAAREDTIIFPAWKKNFTDKQLDELSDEFEDIEHRMFGKDGFDDAEETIGRIEGKLGLADLGQFTPPSPPKP